MSLDLIRRVAPRAEASIIDVGGGASTLVHELVASGYADVTVCDIAEAALRHVSAPKLLCSDILTATLPRAAYDVWHDRAVFHFLTAATDRAKYVEQVAKALKPGGHVVIATFAEDGPTRCSGLEVVRYSPAQLHAAFGPRFHLIDTKREEHLTPAAKIQAFQYCVFQV